MLPCPTNRAFFLTWLVLCKFIGTKEIVYIRKEFNSHRTGLEHQHGRRFIVLEHQYGRCDVMCNSVQLKKAPLFALKHPKRPFLYLFSFGKVAFFCACSV